MAAVKSLMFLSESNGTPRRGHEPALVLENLLFQRVKQSGDAQEGPLADAEKRKLALRSLAAPSRRDALDQMERALDGREEP